MVLVTAKCIEDCCSRSKYVSVISMSACCHTFPGWTGLLSSADQEERVSLTVGVVILVSSLQLSSRVCPTSANAQVASMWSSLIQLCGACICVRLLSECALMLQVLHPCSKVPIASWVINESVTVCGTDAVLQCMSERNEYASIGVHACSSRIDPTV